MSSTARDPTARGQPDENAWLAEAVGLARTGDRLAFDRLYRHFYIPISKYLAHMVGDDEEGYDLAQETFLKVSQALPGLREGQCFQNWLYRIATNKALDHLRRRKLRCLRWEHVEEDGLPEKVWAAGPEEHVAEAEHIRQALARVSPTYRSCLILQIVENLSQREIAALLGISEKSVSVNVSRGSKQFQRAYQHLSQQANSSEPAQKKGANHHGKSRQRFDASSLLGLGPEACGPASG